MSPVVHKNGRRTPSPQFIKKSSRKNRVREQKDVSGMFREASSFNGNLSRWRTSSATDMRYVFNGASSFNGDLSKWDTLSVNNTCRMLYL